MNEPLFLIFLGALTMLVGAMAGSSRDHVTCYQGGHMVFDDETRIDNITQTPNGWVIYAKNKVYVADSCRFQD